MLLLSQPIRSYTALGPRVVRGIIPLGLAVLLAVAAFADGEEAGDWVIPPGREDILGKILGVGEALPGGCALTKGDIQYNLINATYLCNGTEVALKLEHPSQAQSAVATSERFAISSGSGEIPAPLLSALEARLRASEDQFEWEQGVPKAITEEVVAQEITEEGVAQELAAKPRPIEGPLLYAAGAVAVLIIAAFGFVLRKA